MKELHVSSKKREAMIDITTEVQNFIEQEKMTDGYIIIYVPHTTAAVTINEGADPSVQEDIIATLHKLIPRMDSYQHTEGNSDAHIKASLLGCSAIVLVNKGRCVLGTWQHIFFYEGDGPRQRSICIHAVSNIKIK